jgi:small subunit ribosomal protein S4
MTKRLLSKYSVCKKLRNPYTNLWGLKKKESLRSVTSRKKKFTSFSRVLDIKQSFKFFYSNVQENLFKSYITCSIRSPSKTVDKLVSIMESRLDSIVFRSCFVTSFHEARQLINHRFVTVNNSYVTNPKKKIKKGDIVKLNIKVPGKDIFSNILTCRSIPSYLELDFSNLTIVLLWDINFNNVYYPIKTKYSDISRYYV